MAAQHVVLAYSHAFRLRTVDITGFNEIQCFLSMIDREYESRTFGWRTHQEPLVLDTD